MKKRIFRTVTALMCISFLASCGTSEAPNYVVSNQGKQNAIEYCENKYGKTPQIISSKNGWGTGYKGDGNLPELDNIGPSGELKCEMELDGKRFTLWIDGDTKDYKGYDDYEKNIICNDILSDIEKELGVSCKGYFIEYYDSDSFHENCLINLKYTDLETLYSNMNTQVYFATDASISEEDILKFSKKYKLEKMGSYLRIYIGVFNDASNINPEIENSYYVFNLDENVIDYYDINWGSSDTSPTVWHNHELIKD